MRTFHFDEVESTQDESFRLLRSGEPTPFLVTCRKQTKGRGRLAREWLHEEGASLAMSLARRLPTSQLYGLSVLVGYACLEAIDPQHLKLKWPNDLMFQDQKVGGILIEARSSDAEADVVIGVGVNTAQTVGIYHGLNQKLDPEQLGGAILQKVDIFLKEGLSPFRQEIEKVLWRRGEAAPFLVAGVQITVVIEGLTDRGELQLRDGQRLEIASDGEILLGS